MMEIMENNDDDDGIMKKKVGMHHSFDGSHAFDKEEGKSHSFTKCQALS
jgi:hypothetical protein